MKNIPENDAKGSGAWKGMIPIAVSVLALGVSASTLFLNFFYQRHTLNIAIVPLGLAEMDIGEKTDPIPVSPVIFNAGNRTEGILEIRLQSTDDTRGPQRGPFVIKSGDAIVIPLEFDIHSDINKDNCQVTKESFDKVFDKNELFTCDIYVIVRTVGPGGDESHYFPIEKYVLYNEKGRFLPRVEAPIQRIF